MDFYQDHSLITHAGVMAMLAAAIGHAEKIKSPQCIVIVDSSGQLLGEIRMTGAKFLSRKTARAKALTAASTGSPSHNLPESVRVLAGVSSNGDLTGLGGGLPILIDGKLLGGIGVGSGRPDQDIEVATTALKAIGAEIDLNPHA